MRTTADGHQEPHRQSFALSDIILGGQNGMVKVTVGYWYRSGLQMMLIGIVSALIGYLIGLLFKAPVTP